MSWLKRNWLKLVASVLVLIGYTAVILPYAVDEYSRIGQSMTITGYEDKVKSLNQQQIDDAFTASAAYNKKIAEQQKMTPYAYSDEVTMDSDYLSLPVAGSEEICTIVIPKINVNIPVGHGTGDNLLQTMAGHLYGTSLPTGGESTHAVIAAHTALRESEMFSRLDELKEGDQITVKVLGQTHLYEIDQIKIVYPDEADQYLQVKDGQDLITLYTCTPYGINTHRLLVRAHRIADPVQEESGTLNIVSGSTKPILILAGMIALPILLIILINKKL
jgi:sortase A